MNRSYSKIRHIQESNIKLERRLLGEQVSSKNIVDTIRKNIPTIVGVIASLLPVLALPRLIYFIASGGPQELMKQLGEYKDRIDSELKKRNIPISLQDIVDNISEVKDEFTSELKNRSGLKESVQNLFFEQMDGIEEFNQELQDVGEILSMEEIQELQPDCPISSEVPQYEDELKKFEEEVKKMTIPQIKNKIKELKSLERNNKVQEQNYAGDVMGMKVVKGIAGLFILVLIIELFRRIFRGGTRTNKACRQRNRLVRRFGLRGATM